MTASEYHTARQALRDLRDTGAISIDEKQARVKLLRAEFLREPREAAAAAWVRACLVSQS